MFCCIKIVGKFWSCWSCCVLGICANIWLIEYDCFGVGGVGLLFIKPLEATYCIIVGI